MLAGLGKKSTGTCGQKITTCCAKNNQTRRFSHNKPLFPVKAGSFSVRSGAFTPRSALAARGGLGTGVPRRMVSAIRGVSRTKAEQVRFTGRGARGQRSPDFLITALSCAAGTSLPHNCAALADGRTRQGLRSYINPTGGQAPLLRRPSLLARLAACPCTTRSSLAFLASGAAAQ